MIIATRTLQLRTPTGDVDVPTRIHAPEQDDQSWICRIEIDWPDREARQWGTSDDAVGALFFAMQMIGALLYASDHHEDGNLFWLEPGLGYGFPVTQSIRDLLVGQDKQYL